MKSGYSTKILVHKEDIMTNEEIFKYADKALKEEEKRYNSIILGTGILFVIGSVMMYAPVVYSGINIGSVISIISLSFGFIVYLVCMSKYADKYYRVRRNFTYNLVRQDERKRIKNGTL